jgi:DNA-binding sugar fermentation-stimulating protein
MIMVPRAEICAHVRNPGRTTEALCARNKVFLLERQNELEQKLPMVILDTLLLEALDIAALGANIYK